MIGSTGRGVWAPRSAWLHLLRGRATRDVGCLGAVQLPSILNNRLPNKTLLVEPSWESRETMLSSAERPDVRLSRLEGVIRWKKKPDAALS